MDLHHIPLWIQWSRSTLSFTTLWILIVSPHNASRALPHKLSNLLPCILLDTDSLDSLHNFKTSEIPLSKHFQTSEYLECWRTQMLSFVQLSQIQHFGMIPLPWSRSFSLIWGTLKGSYLLNNYHHYLFWYCSSSIPLTPKRAFSTLIRNLTFVHNLQQVFSSTQILLLKKIT